MLTHTPKWIDTHAHLQLLKSSPKTRNIEKIICVATSLDDNINYEIPGIEIYNTVGIHPCSDLNNIDWKIFEDKINAKTVAIGETGLDLYRNSNSLELQIDAFKKQISISQKYNLPLIIHTRNAQKETLAILCEFLNLKAVIHCFDGNLEFLQELLSYDLYISISGLITFKKLPVKHIPIDRLLIETDCPYLTPATLGKIENHPTYIQYTAMYLSNLLNLPLSKLAEITRENTLRLFNKITN